MGVSVCVWGGGGGGVNPPYQTALMTLHNDNICQRHLAERGFMSAGHQPIRGGLSWASGGP